MFRWLSLFGCAVTLVALGVLTVLRASSLEDAVQREVTDGLAVAQIRSTAVVVNGLDVTVEGVAASDMARARTIVDDVDGVQSVMVAEDVRRTGRLGATVIDPTVAAAEVRVSTTVPEAIEQRRPRVVAPSASSDSLASTALSSPHVIADVAGGVVYLRGSVLRQDDHDNLVSLQVAMPLRSRVIIHPDGHPTEPSSSMVAAFADVVETVAEDLDGGQVRLFGSLIEVRGRLADRVEPSEVRFAVELVAAGRCPVMLDLEPVS